MNNGNFYNKPDSKSKIFKSAKSVANWCEKMSNQVDIISEQFFGNSFFIEYRVNKTK